MDIWVIVFSVFLQLVCLRRFNPGAKGSPRVTCCSLVSRMADSALDWSPPPRTRTRAGVC